MRVNSHTEVMVGVSFMDMTGNVGAKEDTSKISTAPAYIFIIHSLLLLISLLCGLLLSSVKKQKQFFQFPTIHYESKTENNLIQMCLLGWTATVGPEL